MNRDCKVIIDTPYGITDHIYLKSAVKQGTVLGPTLCGLETDKINQISGKRY